MLERQSEIGIIKDVAIHDIDIACWLLGNRPKSVFANCIFTDTGRDVYANILLMFEKEFGCLEASWISKAKERSLTVICTKARALLDYLDQSVVLEYADKREKLLIEKENYLKTELSHFVTCILEDATPLVTGLDGLRSLKIAEAALESAIRKKIISIR
jgi:predicted dehydrogenase